MSTRLLLIVYGIMATLSIFLRARVQVLLKHGSGESVPTTTVLTNTTATPTSWPDWHASTSDVPQFDIDVFDCNPSKGVRRINAPRGIVHGFKNLEAFLRDPVTCYIHISVPEGRYVVAYIDRMPCSADRYVGLDIGNKDGNARSKATLLWACPMSGLSDMRHHSTYSPVSSPFISANDQLFINVKTSILSYPWMKPGPFWVRFESVSDRFWERFVLVEESEHAGYLVLPGYHEGFPYPLMMNVSLVLSVPDTNVLMVSFPRFDLQENLLIQNISGHLIPQCDDYLEMHTLATGGSKGTFLWRHCGVQNLMNATVYTQSLSVHFVSDATSMDANTGFKLVYSLHNASVSPVQSANGLFNCSRHYDTFRQHLDCNLIQECQEGEDEHQGCPYNDGHDPLCDTLSVNVLGKCVSYHAFEAGRQYTTWQGARLECQRLGGDLAMPKTPEQLDRIHYIMGIKPKGRCAYVGLQTVPISPSTRSMYRKTLTWVAGTTCYYCNVSKMSRNYMTTVATQIMNTPKKNLYDTYCFVVMLDEVGMYYPVKCSDSTCNTFMCEEKPGSQSEAPENKIIMVADSLRWVGKPFIECPSGLMTHIFLACDRASHCGVKHYVTHCELYVTHNGMVTRPQTGGRASSVGQLVSVEMFECYTMGETIPYTLVCDFRHHCHDGSDELHCQHQELGGFVWCANGQRIIRQGVCDVKDDCVDGSDELDCSQHKGVINEAYHRKPSPVIINMDGRGNFTEEPMHPAAPMPQTHFRCPGQPVYCMPVYLRCNGVKDCPGGEDEVSCDDVTCPGYYRCRSSSVCLHGDHLCDGWPQCPERDDELLCIARCPSVCHCQGHAFVCQQPFAARHYFDLRYLDATGSGMVPEDVAGNFYLVYLSLADCGLKKWPGVAFPNLQTLDLSYNLIEAFQFQYAALLRNIRVLNLRGNPLSSLETGNASFHQSSLISLDMSHTNITNIDSAFIMQFKEMKYLNLSYGGVTRIKERGFSGLPNLLTVDLRGNTVDGFPDSAFSGLDKLQRVFADNYRLCCKAALPASFNTENCFSPQSVLNSCEDLLGVNYRVYVWVVGLVSVISNVLCVVVQRRSKHSKPVSQYTLFVSNLNVANCLTGVYLIAIGVADSVYRGNYVSYESDWKASRTCHSLGILFVLSIEVSFFVMILISIDQVIALRFSTCTICFTGKSAVSALALAWTVGLLLAVVPLLPSLSHWSFYSQTAICFPLVVSENTFPDNNHFFFGILSVIALVVVSFVVFETLLFCPGVCGPPYDAITSGKQTKDLTIARRLKHVVVCNVLCWIPVFALVLMAFVDIPVSEDVGVVITVCLLPLGCALSPLAYLYRLHVEKRQARNRERIVKILERLKPINKG